MTETTTGEGWAVGSIDGMGDGPGFRKVRRELDVKAFGVNAVVMPPGYASGPHYHDRQEELYLVHRGRSSSPSARATRRSTTSSAPAAWPASTPPRSAASATPRTPRRRSTCASAAPTATSAATAGPSASEAPR